jgi:hypothetical protein
VRRAALDRHHHLQYAGADRRVRAAQARRGLPVEDDDRRQQRPGAQGRTCRVGERSATIRRLHVTFLLARSSSCALLSGPGTGDAVVGPNQSPNRARRSVPVIGHFGPQVTLLINFCFFSWPSFY